MINFLKNFPEEKILLNEYPEFVPVEVNAHLHTPYSFSAFEDIPQLFSLAQKENIGVAGINDFFVTDGYDEFATIALKNGIFPLFNIEFTGLLKKEQQKGIRINDPDNPGRCYFSGKGLDYPFHVNTEHAVLLQQVLNESQNHVKAMAEKANVWFAATGVPIKLDFSDIKKKYARNLVRERHIAKAIRIALYQFTAMEQERKDLFKKMFGGKDLQSRMDNISGTENEIRSNLLKAGGKAFIAENENAFLPVDDIIEIILDAGGIPCYPLLLDDKNDNYTEYEKDAEKLWQELTKRNIGCIELISGRNDAQHLHDLVVFFHRKDFVILFGTEHNTPELIPLTCDTRGGKPLPDNLRRFSYEGACVVAAHQYLRAKEQQGFIDQYGLPSSKRKTSFIKLGNAVIHHTLKTYKKAHHGPEAE